MKKTTLFVATLLPLLLSAQAFCANYYVSPTGNDQNDGLSPQTPWATISRVNAADVQPGDQILWQRGGIWRGVLHPHSGKPGLPVVYGAYGEGEKPTFYGSANASQEKDWVEASPNIWATRETRPEILGDVDGRFTANWHVHQEEGADVAFKQTLEDGLKKLDINFKNAGKKRNHVQFWGPEVNAAQFPQSMVVELKVRADRPCEIPGLTVSLDKSPWTQKAVASSFEATQEWQTVQILLERNEKELPKEGNYRFVWHWSLGGLEAGTRLEIVFLGLREAKIDRSLFFPIDIGNIIFDHGKFTKYHRCGMKKWSMNDLKAPGDYFYDPQACRVFLYWDENPAKTCESIELAIRTTVVDQGNVHDVVYENLAVAYGAAHGFGGANTARLVIRNCDLYYIGGGCQYFDSNKRPVRFGNAIEFWNSADGNIVEKCHIWEVYDAALTNQGKGSAEHPSIQKNIIYRDNLIENAEYSFEYWNRDGVTENILFENNTCVDAGVCWSHSQRPNPNGAHMMFYFNSAETKNFVVRNNKFFNSTEVALRMENDWRDGLRMENNVYRQYEGEPLIRWLGKNYFSKETFSNWQKDVGMDQNSLCE